MFLQVSTLAEKLSQPPHSLGTVTLSIDDLYLPHNEQLELAAAHPTNPLIQHRGQPSTHDIPLALSVFSDLRSGKETKIPSYDKSAFTGQGDRVPKGLWETANRKGEYNTRVVIFEGWCVGFQALPVAELRRKWENAERQKETGNYSGRLAFNKLEDVELINEALRRYGQLTRQLDVLIHVDAEDPRFVYNWRIQQETAMRKTKGTGMTDEQVIHFVDGYYPAYELYTDELRTGAFNGEKGKQLRLIIEEDRKLKEVVKI